jgi:predicted SprT family Zn-dependent metalloprotease
MTQPDKILNFVVYGREECHLCEEMILALRGLQAQNSFYFEVVDINKNPELVARYNDKIPVLISQTDNTEICHYHLDLQAFDAYLAKIR